MRGADGNPHQVRLGATRVVELAGRGTAPMGVAPATLDVAPNRDLFVPFEFPVAELEPGWYAIECEVAIDGSPATVRPGKRFAVPWPRGSTRRDQVSLGRSIEVGGDEVRLHRLERTVRARVKVVGRGPAATATPGRPEGFEPGRARGTEGPGALAAAGAGSGEQDVQRPSDHRPTLGRGTDSPQGRWISTGSEAPLIETAKRCWVFSTG